MSTVVEHVALAATSSQRRLSSTVAEMVQCPMPRKNWVSVFACGPAIFGGSLPLSAVNVKRTGSPESSLPLAMTM
jgi:hypothetical protein